MYGYCNIRLLIGDDGIFCIVVVVVLVNLRLLIVVDSDDKDVDNDERDDDNMRSLDDDADADDDALLVTPLTNLRLTIPTSMIMLIFSFIFLLYGRIRWLVHSITLEETKLLKNCVT